MNQIDFLLYGGVAIAGALAIFLGYRILRKRGGERPKSDAMNKINDFFATQDQNHNY